VQGWRGGGVDKPTPKTGGVGQFLKYCACRVGMFPGWQDINNSQFLAYLIWILQQ